MLTYPHGRDAPAQVAAQDDADCVNLVLQNIRVVAGTDELDIDFRDLTQGAGERLDGNAEATDRDPGDLRGAGALFVVLRGSGLSPTAPLPHCFIALTGKRPRGHC